MIADKVKAWHYRPAKWYQFWLPQSGIVGGGIAGAVIATVGLGTAWIVALCWPAHF